MNLAELLTPELVEIDIQVSSWQEAILAAGKLLVDSGMAEERYPDAMIRVAREFGPYIVVAPGIALPHARPEDGAIKSSIAVVRLKDPVNFGNEDNDPVFLVAALVAIDHEQHIQGLAELANMLGDDDCINMMKMAETKQELLSVFLKSTD